MPELPEVEIVKQSLKKKIKNKKIIKVVVRNRNLRFKLQSDFEKNLTNRMINQISRIAKYLILIFDNHKYCIIHLGMSGTVHLINNNQEIEMTNLSFYQSKILPKKHNHIEIIFSKFKIIYNDPRRFGFFKILNNEHEFKSYFNKLGPEALNDDFNIKYLKKNLKNKKKNIKNLLLDQKFVSGIGNIYANEILFYSKINPKKKALKINYKEINQLLKFSKKVLNLAIKFGGSSIKDFKNTQGSMGEFQKEFKVYEKDNEKCPRKKCGGKIIKIFISNRSTFFCNSCQN